MQPVVTDVLWSVCVCVGHIGVLIFSLAVLDPRVGHTTDLLSPFISVLCHSDWLFHGESCPRLDVVRPRCAWSSSPACTWHCSLHYLFLRVTPLFPHGVTIVCYSFLALTVSNSSLFTPALLSPAKTDESIELSFWLWTRVGPRNHVLGLAPDLPQRGAFWGDTLRTQRTRVICKGRQHCSIWLPVLWELVWFFCSHSFPRVILVSVPLLMETAAVCAECRSESSLSHGASDSTSATNELAMSSLSSIVRGPTGTAAGYAQQPQRHSTRLDEMIAAETRQPFSTRLSGQWYFF